MTLCNSTFHSQRQLVPLSGVLFLRALLDRLRLQNSETLIPASFGTVQVSSTTSTLPLRQYPAATALVPSDELVVSLLDQSRTSSTPPAAFASREGIVGRCRVVDRCQLGGPKVRLRKHFILRSSGEGSALSSVRVRSSMGLSQSEFKTVRSNWLLSFLCKSQSKFED